MSLVATIARHLFSLVSLMWVLGNLTAWFMLLLPVSLLRALVPASTRLTAPFVRRIYIWAAAIDSFWMRHVVAVPITIHGTLPRHPSPVVVANHCSWFDIPVIQDLFCGEGLIVKFLIKRELALVPVIGWICVALDFPRLYRGSHQHAKDMDYATIESAGITMAKEPGAMLVFPEGTRFTTTKRDQQGVAFENLLKPRSGGLRVLHAALPPETPLVDLTIRYEPPGVTFWECLHGRADAIQVTISSTTLGEAGDIADWLNKRWAEKDRLLN